MPVSTTEFRDNINKYIDLSSKEDVFIGRYGKNIAVASSANSDKRTLLKSILGVLPEGAAEKMDEARYNRIIKKWKGGVER